MTAYRNAETAELLYAIACDANREHLTTGQAYTLTILITLAAAEDRAQNLSDIAWASPLARSTVMTHLRTLTRLGLITQLPDGNYQPLPRA